MSISFIIALISSISSIIIAIISLIGSRANNKTIHTANTELEKLKYSIEKERSNFQLTETHIKSKLQALDEHIIGIQKIKDILQLSLVATKNSYSSMDALSSIKINREQFFELFENESIHFNLHEEYEVAHKAKNLIINLESLMLQYLKNRRYIYYDDEEIKKLMQLKENLNDCQNLLRDFKFKLILK